MEIQNVIEKQTLRLYVSPQDYLRFHESQKEIFQSRNDEVYFIDFPMKLQESKNQLREYIIACVETALIIPDKKYEITEDTTLSCELMKIGKNEKAFSILVNIWYPMVMEPFYDVLFFKEIKRTDELFEFEFSGDQKIFQL